MIEKEFTAIVGIGARGSSKTTGLYLYAKNLSGYVAIKAKIGNKNLKVPRQILELNIEAGDRFTVICDGGKNDGEELMNKIEEYLHDNDIAE